MCSPSLENSIRRYWTNGTVFGLCASNSETPKSDISYNFRNRVYRTQFTPVNSPILEIKTEYDFLKNLRIKLSVGEYEEVL